MGERNLIVLDGGSITTKVGIIENLTNLPLKFFKNVYYIEWTRYRDGHPVKTPVVLSFLTAISSAIFSWIG